jgi:LuxR family quorum sensing-dependent transcriptional regulator
MNRDEFTKLFSVRRHEVHLMATYVHEKIMGFGLHKPLDGAIRLTPREIEILTWVAKGKSRWEVGIILGISEETVKAHLENIRQKLGASNTTHAIAIALLHGLLLP